MKELTEQDGKSLDIVNENLEALKAIFPESFTEDGVDFEVLRELLGGAVAEGEEKYGLTWHGKKKARQIALTPSIGTLRPCKEESVDWDTTQNLFIEGDNLEVLKLLQKSYANKVKMIYIDPPYNTGNEFIYLDKFQDNLNTYLKYTGLRNEEGEAVSSEIKTGKNSINSARYHTNWLNMMTPRLKIARNLLRQDGVIFISIDDTEVSNLWRLCDEIFGEENRLCSFAWQKRYAPPPDTKDIGYQHETILMYRKSEAFTANLLPLSEEQKARYKNPDNDSRGDWKAMDYTCRYTAEERPNLYYPITNPNSGEECWPKKTRVWAMSKGVTEKNLAENRIWWGVNGTNSTPALKNYLSKIKQGRMPRHYFCMKKLAIQMRRLKSFAHYCQG
jgi:adenine-specific DNA-methyltransferase